MCGPCAVYGGGGYGGFAPGLGYSSLYPAGNGGSPPANGNTGATPAAPRPSLMATARSRYTDYYARTAGPATPRASDGSPASRYTDYYARNAAPATLPATKVRPNETTTLHRDPTTSLVAGAR